MESDDAGARNGPAENVVVLYDTALALEKQRADLDRQLMEMPDADDERERLWQALEQVTDRLSGILLQLAETASTDLNELRAKAGVLRQVLGPPVADPTALSPDVIRLALAIGQEVSALL